MEQIILNGISVDDLLERIKIIIDKKIESSLIEPDNKETYLSRKDVCHLLKITLPTLNDYTKIGRLKSYKIGRRVLYRQDEIQQSLKQVFSMKFKRG